MANGEKTRKQDGWAEALRRIEVCKRERADTLELDDLNLTEIPREVGELTWLTQLSIGTNRIKDLGPLQGLQCLRGLVAHNNQIRDLTPLSELRSLAWLFIPNNQIIDLQPLQVLHQLEDLDIWINQIQDLSPLKNLRQLKNLTAWSNEIQDLSPLSSLVGLQTLDIDLNKVQDLSPLQQFKTLERLSCRDNPITTPPPEVALSGLDAIRAYFDNPDGNTTRFLEVKLLLVGSPGGGKTTLLRRLRGEDIPQEEPGTPGIDLSAWKFSHYGKDYRVNLWDFAGQEINYALHELFYTGRCIYVVLLDGRTEDKPETWLQRIALLAGPEARIVLVRNKQDDAGYRVLPAFDFAALQKQHPQLQLQLFELSARTGAGFDAFEEGLQQVVTQHPQAQDLYPLSWLQVKKEAEELTRLGRNHITHDVFVSLCSKVGIADEAAQAALLRVLGDLGVITYFEDPKLANVRILNPQWLAAAAYKLLAKAEKTGGVLSGQDFAKALVADPAREQEKLLRWQPHEYPWIEAMMQKNLQLLPIPDSKLDGPQYLLPRGLQSTVNPPLDATQGLLRVRLSYKTLPDGLFARAIVRLFRYRKDGLYGRYRMLLERDDNQALLECTERDIRLSINGAWGKRYGFLTVLLEEFRFLHADYEGLQCQYLLPLENDFAGQSLSFKAVDHILQRGQRSGQYTHFNDELNQEFDVLQLLCLPHGQSGHAALAATPSAQTSAQTAAQSSAQLVQTLVQHHTHHHYHAPVSQYMAGRDLQVQQHTVYLDVRERDTIKALSTELDALLALLDTRGHPERADLLALAEELTRLSGQLALTQTQATQSQSLLAKAKSSLEGLLTQAEKAVQTGERVGKLIEVGQKCVPFIEKVLGFFA